MSAWIGPLGNLFEFKCPSAVESSSDDPHVYFRPLGGSVSTTVLGDTTRPRVWDVKVSAARPDDVATLDTLTSGGFGPGPFVFIPPAAETLNLLGKRWALALGDPAIALGYVPQRAGQSIVETTEGPTGTAYVCIVEAPGIGSFGYAPAIPGVPVTGRAWVVNKAGYPGGVRLRFWSGGGELLLTTANAPTVDGGFTHITATPPPGTVRAQLICTGGLIARPSITWTPGPRPWAPSAATQTAVVSPLSNSVRRATGATGEAQITDHAFTVQELTA